LPASPAVRRCYHKSRQVRRARIHEARLEAHDALDVLAASRLAGSRRQDRRLLRVRPRGREWLWPAAIASALFLVACAFAYGGLLSHARPGDTTSYARYGRALVNDGRIPYRDFYDEYPPGSVPVFVLPALIWDAHYVLVFKLLMSACGVGFVACAAWILARLRLSPLRLAPLVLAPALMGPVFLNRYDPLVAFL